MWLLTDAPDTLTGWARGPTTPTLSPCALCLVTAHHTQHWEPATNSLVSYPWDKNATGVSVLLEGQKEKRTPACPAPRLVQVKSSGEQ